MRLCQESYSSLCHVLCHPVIMLCHHDCHCVACDARFVSTGSWHESKHWQLTPAMAGTAGITGVPAMAGMVKIINILFPCNFKSLVFRFFRATVILFDICACKYS